MVPQNRYSRWGYLNITDSHLLGLSQRLVAVVEIDLVVVRHESNLPQYVHVLN